MRVAIWVLGVAAFLLDPIAACDDETHFMYGEREMRAAIEGTWRVTLDDKTMTIEIRGGRKQVSVRGRGWIPDAAACGSQTFVRNAGACFDTSHMELEAKVIDGSKHADGVGDFEVVGTSFTAGHLELGFGPQDWLSATVLPTGEARDVRASHGSTATLSRIKAPASSP